MLRGLYITGTSMGTVARQIDTISENMSNANTPGFKRLFLATQAYGERQISRNGHFIGYTTLGLAMDQVAVDSTPSVLDETSSRLDLAIRGEGYFVMRNRAGDLCLGRGGTFSVDAQGYLITASGARLQGNNGAVRPGTEDFIIDGTGRVYVNGTAVDQLRLSAEPDVLQSLGEGLYAYQAEREGAITGTVEQGALEMSNVDPTSEISLMMQAVRQYQSCQQMVQMMDSTLEKAVNEIGRV